MLFDTVELNFCTVNVFCNQHFGLKINSVVVVVYKRFFFLFTVLLCL